MSILLDSASLRDADVAMSLGFIKGVTTNPALMRLETTEPLAHLAALAEVVRPHDIYYQPVEAHPEILGESERARSVDPARVVLKFMATPQGVTAAAEMVRRGARVALTAAQSPQVMSVAEAIACESVIPYVDRAKKDLRTNSRIVRDLARLRHGKIQIIAASVKDVSQFIEVMEDGGDAVTIPLPLIHSLLTHPAVEEADQAFKENLGAGR